MMIIPYEEVRCPKCGKSHFVVKSDDNLMSNLLYMIHPDPIYKDGVLQNPETPPSSKERFQCKECGCNFRLERMYTAPSIYTDTIIDEDKEREDWKIEKEKCMEEYRQKREQQEKEEAEKKAQTITTLEPGQGIVTLNDCNTGTLGLATTQNIDNHTYTYWSATKARSEFGDGTKSELFLDDNFVIKLDKIFTEEQIKNIKETFGFVVKNKE